MVDDTKLNRDDEFLLEALEDLPRISVPKTMLPDIMDQVMDEHIRSQVRTIFFPAYLMICGLILGLASWMAPSDLGSCQFIETLFSGTQSGILGVLHQMAKIVWQILSRESGRAFALEGLPLFGLLLTGIVVVLFGLGSWIKTLHKRPS
jgi:hypothetical protein